MIAALRAAETERSGGQKGRGLGGRNFCPPSLSDSDFSAAEFRASGTGAPHCIYLLNHSLQFFGQPRSNNKASGAPQFAQRSTKSQIGSDPNGQRIIAVQRPQTAIQRIAIRTGFIRTSNATAISIIPTSISIVPIVSGLVIPTPSKYLNQPAFC